MILSGGEKQRMAWARLFLRRPRFGLLDEASAGVSVEVLEHLYETAASYDITLLTISHEPAGEPPAPTPSEDCHAPSRHARHFVRSEELTVVWLLLRSGAFSLSDGGASGGRQVAAAPERSGAGGGGAGDPRQGNCDAGWHQVQGRRLTERSGCCRVVCKENFRSRTRSIHRSAPAASAPRPAATG